MSNEILENPVTGERMEVLESTAATFRIQYSMRPHASIPSEHYHPGKAQVISVLAGEMHLRVNGVESVVHAGESATVPESGTHFQWNPTDNETNTIEEIKPAGRIHPFFRSMFNLAHDGKLSGGISSLLLTMAVLHEFRDSIVPADLPGRAMVAIVGPLAIMLGYRREFAKYIY